MEEFVAKTIAYVKRELEGAEGGHDWFHIERVYKNALLIANKSTHCDMEVVVLAALLHDIADSKFNDGNEEIGPEKAKVFLESIGVSESVMEHVVKIIENISFKGGNFEKTFSSLELQIVQDADRLDAIGAVGIARAFHYGGFKNRTIYNPDVAPKMTMSKEDYKRDNGPTINHFYEKLLLLKDRMNTEAAKEIAGQRHRFMELFLSQFYSEWQGDK